MYASLHVRALRFYALGIVLGWTMVTAGVLWAAMLAVTQTAPTSFIYVAAGLLAVGSVVASIFHGKHRRARVMLASQRLGRPVSDLRTVKFGTVIDKDCEGAEFGSPIYYAVLKGYNDALEVIEERRYYSRDEWDKLEIDQPIPA